MYDGIKKRSRGGQGARMPLESYPSPHAPDSFRGADAERQRKAQGEMRVSSVDNEPNFGNCVQCNFPQDLGESETCLNCGSDNREGREFPSSG